jgi:uncharacterized protein involved in cysteine biosynthesis
MGFSDGAKAAARRAAGVPKATVVGFWKGLAYPFRGAKLVFFEHPGLVRFWGIPILITGALLVAVLWGGWAWHEDVTNLVWADPADAAGELLKSFPEAGKEKPELGDKRLERAGGLWVEAGHWAHTALEILVLLLLWAVGLVLVVFLTNVVAAPFNDLLSEEVEHLLIGKKGPDFSLKILVRDSVRTVGLEAVKMVLYLAVMVPLYLLSLLLPGIGQVIYTIFAFLFTAFYFAIDYVDWPASRRNRGVGYRFGMLRAHFLPMFGFGTGVWLFLFIPLVNLLFMPAAVAGGTMLFLDLEGETAARRRETGP